MQSVTGYYMDMCEDYSAKAAALVAENKRLRQALEEIASCAPDGFATFQECNADMRRWAQEALDGAVQVRSRIMGASR